MSQAIAGAPRTSWADDWEPWPPHPRPAATARPVAAGATAGEIAREAAPAPPRLGRRELGLGVLLAGAAVATAAVAVLVSLAASGGAELRRHAAEPAAHRAAPPQAGTHPHRGATPRNAAVAPPAAHPAAPPLAPAGAKSPAGLVTAYYAALDARRFREAWAVLAPDVRREFGGFGHWRAGYATTLSSRPRQLRVTSAGPGAWEVRAVLVARDRTACGVPLQRRFAVRWRLARAARIWSVTALSATALTPGKPCS